MFLIGIFLPCNNGSMNNKRKYIYLSKGFDYRISSSNKFICISIKGMASKKKVQMTVEEIQAQLEKRASQMNEGKKNGNYAEAENCRLAIEELKKDYEVRKKYDLDQKQKQEREDVERNQEDERRALGDGWEKKMNDYEINGQKMQKQMAKRHENQKQETKENLQKQLPTKIKESSQLLNLRKMEEYMVKQQNFAEAHKAQQRCAEMEKAETDAWMNARNNKIQASLVKLAQKQENQLQILRKRIKTGLQQNIKLKKKEEQKLNFKHANVRKQLKMQHDKEIIALQGQFRNKGGNSSPVKARTFIK